MPKTVTRSDVTVRTKNLRSYYQLHGYFFLGYEFILSEANLSYEAKPSAINLPNLNINSYPKNMSPCNDFITYFFVDEMDIFTRLSLPMRYGFLRHG